MLGVSQLCTGTLWNLSSGEISPSKWHFSNSLSFARTVIVCIRLETTSNIRYISDSRRNQTPPPPPPPPHVWHMPCVYHVYIMSNKYTYISDSRPIYQTWFRPESDWLQRYEITQTDLVIGSGDIRLERYQTREMSDYAPNHVWYVSDSRRNPPVSQERGGKYIYREDAWCFKSNTYRVYYTVYVSL
jgi:hypothetical protein